MLLSLKLQETKPTLGLGLKYQPLTLAPSPLGLPPQDKAQDAG